MMPEFPPGLLESVDSRVREAFDVDRDGPPIIFNENCPFDIAFSYILEERGSEKIEIHPDWYSDVDAFAVRWGISEEMSHFCHYLLNRPLFEESSHGIRSGSSSNNRLLEIANLKEFVARLGGFYGGATPPDFGRTMERWKKLMESSRAETKEEFDAVLESNPIYARYVADVSRRVWGTALGDDISSRFERSVPYDLLRSFARSKSFTEAAQESRRLYSDSSLADEISFVANTFFRRD